MGMNSSRPPSAASSTPYGTPMIAKTMAYAVKAASDSTTRGSHVARQQHVYIGQNLVGQRAPRPRVEQFEKVLPDGAAVLEKEEGQNRDDDHVDQVAGHGDKPQAGLRERRQQVGGPLGDRGTDLLDRVRLGIVEPWRRARAGFLPALDHIGEIFNKAVGLLHHQRADLDSSQNRGSQDNDIGESERGRAGAGGQETIQEIDQR